MQLPLLFMKYKFHFDHKFPPFRNKMIFRQTAKTIFSPSNLIFFPFFFMPPLFFGYLCICVEFIFCLQLFLLAANPKNTKSSTEIGMAGRGIKEKGCGRWKWLWRW